MKIFKKTLSCFIAFLASCSFFACSPVEVEGYSDIKKACSDGRFDVAYILLEKQELDFSDYCGEERYIFSKEIEFLSEELNKENVNAIKAAFKRKLKSGYGHKNTLCEKLVKDAIEVGNIDLCEEMIKLHHDGSFSEEMFIEILNFYKKENIGKFKEYATTLLSGDNDYYVKEYLLNYIKDSNDAEMFNIILSKYSVDKIIENEEIRDLVIKLHPEKLKQLVRTRILEEQKKVAAMPSIGIVKKTNYGDIPEEYSLYQSDVNRYNKLCIEMLSHAIALEDKSLANFIISSMKKNIEYRKTPGDEYEVKLNTEDIDVARQQCNAFFN